MVLVYGITDKGIVREHNEDDFIARKIKGNKVIIGCVIDGVGGYEGGEVAAAISKETINKHLSGVRDYRIDGLKQALSLANDAILQAKETGAPTQMACVVTLVVADGSQNMAYYVHVGDTRLYLFRDGSLVKLTRDQSFVGLLEDSGRITEEEAMQHPKRNEIDKALGFVRNLPPDYFETGTVPFLPDDIFLLCTDGLTDLVNATEITKCLSKKISLEQKCRELVRIANEYGGKDNITVVLMKNGKEQKQQPAITPRQVILPSTQQQPMKQEVPVEPIQTQKKKNNKRWLPFLILIVLMAVIAIWYWFNKEDGSKDELVIPMKGNTIRIHDTIGKSGQIIFLDPVFFGDTVRIEDTLIIDQDSLTLQGTGATVFTSIDNNALSIAPGIHFLKLSHLELFNLQVRISSNELSSVYLDSVRLKNVHIGIDEGVPIKDTMISGKLSELISNLKRVPG